MAEGSGKCLQRCLACFGLFDVIFSIVFLSCSAMYMATCKAEDTSVITSATTPEQMKFFSKAKNDCGYKEESQVPSTDVICKQLELRVLPYLITSTILNFSFGVFIQIIATDKYFLLDDKKGNRQQNNGRLQSLALVPFGILFDMCFTMVGIFQYADPRFCWLAYSITEMTITHTRVAVIILLIIMLSIYKPIELAIYFFYTCHLIAMSDNLGESSSVTFDLAGQLHLERATTKELSEPTISKKGVIIEQEDGTPVLKYRPQNTS